MKKHAYLIMCHNNLKILKELLKILDDERNDIYIHIDKMVSLCPLEELKILVKKSQLYFVKRFNVNWGGFSQITAELELLKSAVVKNYVYYHLISGVDFPIKTQDYIHEFFKENYGKEFIGLDTINNEISKERVQYYYFLQDKIGRNRGKKIALLSKLEKGSLKIQKKLKVDRIKKCPFEIYKGDNWFSITHNMAMYLLEKEKVIKKYFNFGICADELFVQSIVMDSPYRFHVAGTCLRFTDWNRGTPYVFTKEDFDELVHSEKIFARKFDENIDFAIINMLKEYVMENRRD